MTAVASPPSFQPLPRLGWNTGNSAQGGLTSMSADDVTRMFLPRKVPERSNSSSSISSVASTSSSTSTSTISSSGSQVNTVARKAEPNTQSERENWVQRKKPARGFWPSSKAEPVSGVTNARSQPLLPPSSGASAAAAMSAAMTAVHQPPPVLPSQNMPQSTQQINGIRPGLGQSGPESAAVLALLPMNGTFERKQIAVPLFPELLRIGRQTNAKTVPTPVNGFFDSKVLSRQHAEVWADRNGKIWIRDVKSSNGTFVNGARLSAENRDSEPHELRENDMLELGIDIVSEDQKSIVHHKVSAKVEHAGILNNSSNIMDLNFGDIDPGSGGGLMGPPFPQHMIQMRGRNGSQGSMAGNGRISGLSNMMAGNMNGYGAQRQMNAWLSPITIEQVVKKLMTELKQAKQQSQDLHRTSDFFHVLLAHEPGQEPPKPPVDILSPDSLPNGTSLPAKIDLILPFSQPPAPPPQQPLPEKPDAARSGTTDASVQSSPKRSDHDRTRSSPTSSPTKLEAPSSQIISLVEALTSAKREIDSQGDRVKLLEDLLRQERKARESAEERARRLLDRSKALGVTGSGIVEEDAFEPPADIVTPAERDTPNGYEADDEGKRNGKRSPKLVSASASPSASTIGETQSNIQESDTVALRMQEKLDILTREIDETKLQMERYRRRAEGAEETRDGLAQMVERIRRGEIDAKEVDTTSERRNSSETATQTEADAHAAGYGGIFEAESGAMDSKSSSEFNERRVPSRKEVQDLQDAATSALARLNYRNDRMMQSAPYASMLGVVLIGVGIMTYLNGWQKAER